MMESRNQKFKTKSKSPKNKKGKKRGIEKWRKFLAIFFFLLAIILFSLGPIRTYVLTLFEQDGKQQIQQVTLEQIKQNQLQEGKFDFEEVKPLDLAGVMGARLSNEAYSTVGVIAIPSVNINLPIIRGVSNAGLYVGAGTMKPEQKMGEGNYSLAGHNYPGKPTILFSPLDKLQIGEKIYITDLEYIYEYATNNIYTVDEHQVEVIDDVTDKTMITLVKCNLKDTLRDIYQGELISKTPVAEASEDVTQLFNIDFTRSE